MQELNEKMPNIFKSEHARDDVLERYKEHLRLWPVPSEQMFISTRHGETFVVASGSKDAPPVILLHGTMSNAASWMREVAEWAKTFRVYAVDIIGDAGLSAPVRPSFTSDGHSLWLSDVMDGLALSRASLVGNSLGGGVALGFAIHQPRRVDSLTLVCPGGLSNKNIIWWALPLLLLGSWGAQKVRERIVGKFPEPDSDEAKKFAEFTDVIFKSMRPRTQTMPAFTDEQLSRLAMPVFALLGGRDVTMDSRLIKRRIEQHVRHAEVLLYPDASHYLGDQSIPIAEFLQRIYSGAFRE